MTISPMGNSYDNFYGTGRTSAGYGAADSALSMKITEDTGKTGIEPLSGKNGRKMVPKNPERHSFPARNAMTGRKKRVSKTPLKNARPVRTANTRTVPTRWYPSRALSMYPRKALPPQYAPTNRSMYPMPTKKRPQRTEK